MSLSNVCTKRLTLGHVDVQAQLFAASETVASLLLLLPMATGGLQLSFHLYFNHLEVGTFPSHPTCDPSAIC